MRHTKKIKPTIQLACCGRCSLKENVRTVRFFGLVHKYKKDVWSKKNYTRYFLWR